jgi:hypothetical protein
MEWPGRRVGTLNEPAIGEEARIDIAQEYEVHYWTARLECTSRQLREAVHAAGSRAVDVVAYLRDHADE